MSDRIPSRLEDLANELWLEIFEHLDWINLFSAFYGLNKRINQLLMCIKVLSIYSSYLLKYSNFTCILFQEFPLQAFRQIQHFRLTRDSSFEDALDILKHLPSFSTLTSLAIHADCIRSEGGDELATICFRKQFPFLQRLDLHGSIFDRQRESFPNACTFSFPSLLYINVNRLHYKTALQILDQCSQLRSFSAKLYAHIDELLTSVPSITLSTRITMGLPALRKLSLGDEFFFRNEFSSTLLEQLLPCCPNLRTFSFHYACKQTGLTQLNPDWWTRILATNNRLKRFSLELFIHGTFHSLPEETVQRFRLLPFFVRLNVGVTYKIERVEFPRMIHIYAIKN